MELQFNGKKTIKEIYANALSVNTNCIINPDKSLLLKCDNFIGLSTLLQNDYEGKIDLIYIDPPYNTNQTFFVSKDRSNTISKDTAGETAYKDDRPFEDYLSFMWERFVLLHKLLSEQGSLYVHIDIKTGHYLKILLDEIFGMANYKNDIARIKSNPKNFDRRAYGNERDMILFYTKNSKKNIWNDITIPLENDEIDNRYPKIDAKGRYTTIPLHAPGKTTTGVTGQPWRGLLPPVGRHWRTDPKVFDKLDEQGLIEWSSNGNPRIKKYAQDNKGKKVQDVWKYKDPQNPQYPTQKNISMIEFIVKQSSNINSIVLDCFAGGGTTLFACENTGRKWIGMDQSNIAIKNIVNNLTLLSYYDYFDLMK